VNAVDIGSPTATRRVLTDLGEAVLVARARDGDPRCFEVLLRRHQQSLYALAVRLLDDRIEAQDAVQDAFILAWRKLPAFRGEAKFSTWLYRIVTNQCLSRLRRGRQQQPLPEREKQHLVAPEDLSPQAYVEHAALAAALSAAVAALPDDLRLAWLLREAEHRSYEEVAAITGTRVSTIRGRIARARARLADSLAEWR